MKKAKSSWPCFQALHVNNLPDSVFGQGVCTQVSTCFSLLQNKKKTQKHSFNKQSDIGICRRQVGQTFHKSATSGTTNQYKDMSLLPQFCHQFQGLFANEGHRSGGADGQRPHGHRTRGILGQVKDAPVLRQRAVALQLVVGDVDQGAIDIAEDQFGVTWPAWKVVHGWKVFQTKSIVWCGRCLGNMAEVLWGQIVWGEAAKTGSLYYPPKQCMFNGKSFKLPYICIVWSPQNWVIQCSLRNPLTNDHIHKSTSLVVLSPFGEQLARGSRARRWANKSCSTFCSLGQVHERYTPWKLYLESRWLATPMMIWGYHHLRKHPYSQWFFSAASQRFSATFGNHWVDTPYKSSSWTDLKFCCILVTWKKEKN